MCVALVDVRYSPVFGLRPFRSHSFDSRSDRRALFVRVSGKDYCSRPREQRAPVNCIQYAFPNCSIRCCRPRRSSTAHMSTDDEGTAVNNETDPTVDDITFRKASESGNVRAMQRLLALPAELRIDPAVGAPLQRGLPHAREAKPVRLVPRPYVHSCTPFRWQRCQLSHLHGEHEWAHASAAIAACSSARAGVDPTTDNYLQQDPPHVRGPAPAGVSQHQHAHSHMLDTERRCGLQLASLRIQAAMRAEC